MNFSSFQKNAHLKPFVENSFETFFKFGSGLEDLSFCDFFNKIALGFFYFFKKNSFIIGIILFLSKRIPFSPLVITHIEFFSSYNPSPALDQAKHQIPVVFILLYIFILFISPPNIFLSFSWTPLIFKGSTNFL